MGPTRVEISEQKLRLMGRALAEQQTSDWGMAKLVNFGAIGEGIGAAIFVGLKRLVVQESRKLTK